MLDTITFAVVMQSANQPTLSKLVLLPDMFALHMSIVTAQCESCLRSLREIWPPEMLNGNTEPGISQNIFTKEA